MGILILQAIGGGVCWALQKNSRVKPTIISGFQKFHRILGWLVQIIAFIQLIVATVFT